MRKAAAGYKPKVQYPQSQLSRAMGLTVGLIAGGLATRVFYLLVRGFDTHTNQRGRHDRLMTVLGGTVAAFLEDLQEHGVADRCSRSRSSAAASKRTPRLGRYRPRRGRPHRFDKLPLFGSTRRGAF